MMLKGPTKIKRVAFWMLMHLVARPSLVFVDRVQRIVRRLSQRWGIEIKW
jgi:hypothetical protein